MTGEAASIAATDRPRTTESLARDLRALGIRPGDVVLVHSSLSALGWVNGGAEAAAAALLAAVGEDGTVVVPTQTGDRSDPAVWSNPPVPEGWVTEIRDAMPVYDPARTPARGMGAIAELLRTWPGALRSAHPHHSFAAIGPAAASIVEPHDLEDSLGDRSPLGRLYELDARILLLGAGHASNTSLHLAEYRSGVRARTQDSAPMLIDGVRRWHEWSDIALDATVFARLGADLDASGAVSIGRVGSAEARLMAQRDAVDFAVAWLRERVG